ncbi:MAG TPA: peptidoglycan DD-metalloendopeptidase family protein [Acidimicrobiia bacterium]
MLSRRRLAVVAIICVWSMVVQARAHTASAQPAAEWLPPVPGPVVRPFVQPIALYAAGHRGVDFAAGSGTQVRAANDGTVSFAGDVAGSLHVVVAHDGGIRTSYSFLASADVRTGDDVRRGQVIGTAGGSGEGHEPGVLHFGVRVGDRYIDPLLLFRPRDLTQIVRLVPAEELAAAEHPDPFEERRALQEWIESQFQGCAVCGASDWVADHAAAALGAGIGLLEDAGDAGLSWAPVVADALDTTLRVVLDAADEAKRAALSTPAGRMLQDFVTAGASFLGWFARECDAHAPPANGEGGSGNAMLAVGGLDSHRERGDESSFDLAAGALGYDESDRHWFSYRKGSEDYTKQDTYGDLRRKARMLGAQLRRAAREEPGRRFDLIGHSQGGVVIALFLATVYRGHEADYPPIDHVVTFASPLKGTPLATTGDRVASNPVGRAVMEGLGASDLPVPDPLATSIRQLAEGSDVIRDIDEADLPERIDFTSIAGVEDAEVPAGSTRLDGTRQQSVDVGDPLSSHGSITTHPRALMAARAVLEDRRLPCTSFGENVKGSIGSALLAQVERVGAQLVPG